MKKILLAASLVGLVIGCSQPYSNQESGQEPSPHQSARQGVNPIPGQYIVVLKEDANLSGLGAQMKGKALGLLQKNGADESSLGFVYAHALQGFSARLNPAQLRALAADDAVAYIEEDQEVTLVQKGGKPGGGGTTPSAQETPWGITRVGSFVDVTTLQSNDPVKSRTAWIIDTGIDLDHPDLNVEKSSSLTFSAFSSGRDSSPDDGNGHGTHVAGTVAALNNSIGVVGVAAGAKVVPVKVLSSSGSGSTSGVIAGVNHVAAKATSGDVANMSLGGGVSQSLDDAVIAAARDKGIKFAIAAGNSSANANNSSPARANHANIYTVSAHDINDKFASFSNYGNPPIDFCAPGVSIKSTWKSGGYNTISGTSMAAPHVCGILLLGDIRPRGTVDGDPDGNPDTMAKH